MTVEPPQGDVLRNIEAVNVRGRSKLDEVFEPQAVQGVASHLKGISNGPVAR